MGSPGLGNRVVKYLRITAFAAGCLMVTAALLADVIGLSAGRGFSFNQVLFMSAGIILIAAGILGRKFAVLYRGAAVLLLNVILVLVVVELLSLVAVKVLDSERFTHRVRRIEEMGGTGRQRTVLISRYVPWVLWRSNPSDPHDPVYVDTDGFRQIPGTSDSADAFRVFLLGGSTMWGAGQPDTCTIGAYMQLELEEMLDGPVSIMNLAQNAHTSTQEVIELMLQLRSGNVPDFVVFLDGFNDIWAAYESGIAGVHHSYVPISARIEGRDRPDDLAGALVELFQRSNIWVLYVVLRDKGLFPQQAVDLDRLYNYSNLGVDCDSLAEAVVDVCLQNYSLVDHLASSYGFESIYIWQPSLWFGGKTLTEWETELQGGGPNHQALPGCDPSFNELLVASYTMYADSITGDSPHYQSFAGIFDGYEETVYTDPCGVHLEPWANRVVADGMIAGMLAIDPTLAGGIPEEPDSVAQAVPAVP